MAAYNHAGYISQAISSVLAQSWPHFELIVVDDGSTDRTHEVVEGFNDPRVRYIYQENQGQGSARNTGIAHARGEYVCFLDDDDLWLPNYLETVLAVLQPRPEVGALYAACQVIDGEGNYLPQIMSRVVAPERMYDALVEGGWFPPLVVTVRKVVLDDVGPLDPSLRGNDDWELWLRIARRYVFVGIPDVVGLYRIHSSGLSANIEHMLHDQIKAIARHFGREEGDPSTWSSVRRRAYGSAYRTAAFGHIQSNRVEQSYLLLQHAFRFCPELVEDRHTFYELALGDQPRGSRGEVEGLDIVANGAELLRRVDVLFADAAAPLRTRRRAAYSNVYLALTMLSDQAGYWQQARRYLWRALRIHPTLLRQPGVVRRLFKLYAGKRIIDGVQRIRARV